MKKIIKKGISVLAVTAIMLAAAGCSSKTCSICGKSYSSGGTSQTVLGEEINICPDCQSSAANLLGNLG